jgi:GxxExxY protein
LVAQQYPISVTYKGSVIGQYSVDLLVEEVLMIELKTARALDEVHRLQCVNYLKATGLNLCLLLNFGKPKLEFRRVIHGR